MTVSVRLKLGFPARLLSDGEWQRVARSIQSGMQIRHAVEALSPPSREGQPNHCPLCRERSALLTDVQEDKP